MKKSRTIHLRNVVDLEADNFDEEMQLVFYDYKKKLYVNLHLPQRWIKLIAGSLWKVIKDEERELDKIIDSMSLKP